MKFAMIPINRRYNEKNERVVRRVLISYVRKTKNGLYKKTKIIEKDPYFYNKNSSQQYEFTDDGFKLISNDYSKQGGLANVIQDSFINEIRPYEYDAGRLVETAVEFEAKDLQEAIEMFNNRTEVH